MKFYQNEWFYVYVISCALMLFLVSASLAQARYAYDKLAENNISVNAEHQVNLNLAKIRIFKKEL